MFRNRGRRRMHKPSGGWIMAKSHLREKRSAADAMSATQRLKELEMYFEGKGKVYQTLRRVAKRLQKANIPYAVLGGIALAIHRYERATKDVDLLLTPEGLQEFRSRFLEKNYDLVPGRERRFLDRTSGVTIDILVTGLFPGFGKEKLFPFPPPEDVAEVVDDICYVNLAALIDLKLAARRWRDFADVVELIRFNDLDESFLDQLHPEV